MLSYGFSLDRYSLEVTLIPINHFLHDVCLFKGTCCFCNTLRMFLSIKTQWKAEVQVNFYSSLRRALTDIMCVLQFCRCVQDMCGDESSKGRSPTRRKASQLSEKSLQRLISTLQCWKQDQDGLQVSMYHEYHPRGERRPSCRRNPFRGWYQHCSAGNKTRMVYRLVCTTNVTHTEKGVPAVGEIPSEADINTAVLETAPRCPTGIYPECEMWKYRKCLVFHWQFHQFCYNFFSLNTTLSSVKQYIPENFSKIINIYCLTLMKLLDLFLDLAVPNFIFSLTVWLMLYRLEKWSI